MRYIFPYTMLPTFVVLNSTQGFLTSPPFTRICIFLKIFSSVLVCRPHVNIVSSTKSAGFQKRSLEWIFFKTPVYYSLHVDGRKRR